jgi:predicted 3-demethylubiquinone-9 3-methyltransferase (glyoxalase superfamily)
MQKITPFLWFDGQAGAAAKFYASSFKKSRIHSLSPISASFTLAGLDFLALNGGPQFQFTPAISFFVACESRREIDSLWRKLSREGVALMGLEKYPFSERFGWVQDKFGISWQLNLTGTKQKISPFLMFVGQQHGRAERAIRFYVSLFANSKIGEIKRYNGEDEMERKGTVKQAKFSLVKQQFLAMDSGRKHPFTFTPAISFFVNCDTQKQIDYFWKKLSAGGEKDRCGWLKDKFGVSWQIIPSILGELLNNEDEEKANRARQAMLKMKKLEIMKLKQAASQK